jgi:hypothetical protein
MEFMQETGAGMLDEKSIRLLISNALERPREDSGVRLGIVIIQKRSLIEQLLGPVVTSKARNLVWFWKCGIELQSLQPGVLASRLVQKASERGLCAVEVRIASGLPDGFLPEELSVPGGFVPGDAVLIGYPGEGNARLALQRNPEMLMWIK